MSGRGGKKEITDFTINQAYYGNDIYPLLTQVPLSSANIYTQIACGEDFTLLLTTSGNVLSTGNGSFGLHCLSHFKDRAEFASVGSETLNGGFFESSGIKQISAGESHCAALDKHGQVYLWGRNFYGECGERPDVATIVNTPRIARYYAQGAERPFIMVACGGYHTLLLNIDNDVCAMGMNDHG